MFLIRGMKHILLVDIWEKFRLYVVLDIMEGLVTVGPPSGHSLRSPEGPAANKNSSALLPRYNAHTIIDSLICQLSKLSAHAIHPFPTNLGREFPHQ